MYFERPDPADALEEARRYANEIDDADRKAMAHVAVCIAEAVIWQMDVSAGLVYDQLNGIGGLLDHGQ